MTQVRGVLDADAATIYLAEDERLARLDGRRARRAARFGEGFAGRAAEFASLRVAESARARMLAQAGATR